ncbi:ankyrin repeat domain-containing protein [Myxococcus sp. K38C18041901]|uniref:ankyrin repeat domain-containing protein n=1 Tax=Myxococcus guangdongensis TaxID=2906760 RepID=UPI0020A75DC5|nr:ankyrin repeat domain-containing protein [Myxococcus guangdongensis]MCP3063519.1 ankyrin repeat domain-containing protein [Myxococcus guangdongensis]
MAQKKTTKPSSPAKPAGAKKSPKPKRAPAPYGDDARALESASAKGDVAAVKALLARGVPVHSAEPTTGQTSLHVAAREGRLTVVDLLLEAGADAAAQMRRSKVTPLYQAVLHEHVAVVKRLLEEDVPLDGIQGTKSMSPLQCAARTGNVKLVNLLLDAGAPLEQKDKFELTPLAHGFFDDDNPVVKVLLERGARLDALPAHITEQLATWEQYASVRPLLYEYGFPRPTAKAGGKKA